ncbi:MAG: SGNH/GDSL hydrolase family protein [Candidatus Omnitrophica bacterium]|nr:SGNH/GDSL hydrolase family protein [Candidatus Omnitrophota bacterium]
MKSIFKRHPHIILFFTTLVCLILLFLLAEVFLRLTGTYHVATIGHRYSKNAQRYGWGYSPYEMIRVRNPDTGEVYNDRANQGGWRDLDRSYHNASGAYRILVLGDSSTFGVIVPAKKVYTRVLEDKLIREGYHVEVINMGYGKWGTDQELEAFLREGIKYRPNLVIVQFNMNDLGDNTYFHNGASNKKGWKPFYYELDGEGRLQRRENPYFRKRSDALRIRLKSILDASEVLKRFYAFYIYLQYREPSDQQTKYRVKNRKQLEQLKLTINLKEDSPLYQYLDEHRNEQLSLNNLNRIMDASGFDGEVRRAVLRIVEDRWFHQFWNPKEYYPEEADRGSYPWRLYFALIAEIKKQADPIGSDVVVFNKSELGSYEFGRYWFRISDDSLSKMNYLSHIPMMRSVLAE